LGAAAGTGLAAGATAVGTTTGLMTGDTGFGAARVGIGDLPTAGAGRTSSDGVPKMLSSWGSCFCDSSSACSPLDRACNIFAIRSLSVSAMTHLSWLPIFPYATGNAAIIV
jgi:hypothetical protein